MKQQQFDQWKAEQETNKIQIQYRETFNRFNTKDSYTRNITHNTESSADLNLSGSGRDSCWFYEENYWDEEACDRRRKNHNDKDNKNNIPQNML